MNFDVEMLKCWMRCCRKCWGRVARFWLGSWDPARLLASSTSFSALSCALLIPGRTKEGAGNMSKPS